MRESQITSALAVVTAISWTGGKDCNLALLASWRNPSLHVTCLVCFQLEQSNSRAHPSKIMEAQADSLELPLIYVTIPSDTIDYKKSYVKGIKQLIDNHGIKVIVTGDMDEVGTIKGNWIEDCCKEAGIRAFLPLWKANRSDCLQELLDENFDVIFTCVKSPWFDGRWIGRKLDIKTLAILKAMSKEKVSPESSHMPLDLGGERGEYHTMCINGPLYDRPVEIRMLEKPIEEVRDEAERKKKGWQGNIHFAQRLWTIAVK